MSSLAEEETPELSFDTWADENSGSQIRLSECEGVLGQSSERAFVSGRAFHKGASCKGEIAKTHLDVVEACSVGMQQKLAERCR